MSPDPAALVNYALRNGGTASVVKLAKTLNECKTIRKTARALGKHESQVSRLVSRIFTVQYVLHPELTETFTALKEMEESDYERLRHSGQLLPFTSKRDSERLGGSEISSPLDDD